MLPRSLPPSVRARGVTAVLGPTNTGKTHLAIERMLGHGAGLIGLPLRLLARDSGSLAVLPAIVVKDELDRGMLQLYAAVPGVEETFYAITVRKRFETRRLQALFDRFAAAGQG